MSDTEFWQQVRRALMMIAHALKKRYGWDGLLILLAGENNRKEQQ